MAEFEVPLELASTVPAPPPRPSMSPEIKEKLAQARQSRQPSSLIPPRRTGPSRKFRSKTDFIRRFISAKQDASDPKSVTRFVAMLENMVRIASGRTPQAVLAFNSLMAYAIGKPKPSDEEIDAISKGGIQLVYVAQPSVDGDIPFAETKTLTAPEFIEAEFEED